MEEAETYRKIMEEAREYLLSFDEVKDKMIDKHLNDWDRNLPSSIEEVLEEILKSACRREGMRGINDEIVENLKPTLHAYSPNFLIGKFGNNWEDIFKTIQEDYSPDRPKMDIDEPKNPWVRFSKTVVDASYFLSQFPNFEKFDELASRFDGEGNIDKRMALPLFIESRIRGIGFRLACDFLKGNGYPHYIKPDRHITKILTSLDICDDDGPYTVFKDGINFAEIVGELPYKVDKLFWLVGSGKFYLNNTNINTNSSEFIDKVQSGT